MKSLLIANTKNHKGYSKKQKIEALIFVGLIVMFPLAGTVLEVMDGSDNAVVEAKDPAWEAERTIRERELAIDEITEAACTAINESGGICY